MGATCEKPKEFVEPLDYHIYNPQADKAVGFINQLTHGKGFTAGQKFNLRPWQEFKIIRPIFGLVKEDPNLPPEKWLRLIKTAFLEIPRKNGKSEIAGAIAELDEEQVKIYKDMSPAQKFYQATSIIDFGKRVSLEREQI